MLPPASTTYVSIQLPNILLPNRVSAASSQTSPAIGRLSIFASCAFEPSPPSLPPSLVFLASVWHALPYLRLATIIHTRPRSTPTPRPSTPFHHAPPSCTPCIYLLIKREFTSQRLVDKRALPYPLQIYHQVHNQVTPPGMGFDAINQKSRAVNTTCGPLSKFEWSGRYLNGRK